MIASKKIDLGTKIQHADTLVMGVGNYLMGDEGVGVHIAQKMEKIQLPSYLAALDGGTGGFFLMNYFDEYPHVIFVDATMDGKPVGTVTLTEPKFAADFPNALSVHDVGLKDMIETLYFIGNLPKLYLITISIKEIIPMHVGLSLEVEKSIPVVIDEILKLAKQIHD
ncbi:MAG: hydrogenase maturation protease [Cyclobacteriaceae bacterium]|nr:hydrogenase maturation protease [Cyclobacteriaceae bacterium]